MEQPVTPAPAAPAATPTPPAGGQLDLQQIKTMLNLPETATDIELITALVELVAGLQQKYEALLGDAVKLEDKLTNRDLADFQDLITNDTQEFWRDQLLTNRDGALIVLQQIRAAKPAAPAAPAKPEARIPLRNRLADQPRTLAALGEAAAGDPASAVKIRNRAMEIRKAERVPYAEAFSRAEKELSAT